MSGFFVLWEKIEMIRTTFLLSFALIHLFTLRTVHSDSSPVRQTTNGPVEGIELRSSLGQKYYAFKGVPFAEPPITGKDPYTGKHIDRRFKVFQHHSMHS